MKLTPRKIGPYETKDGSQASMAIGELVSDWGAETVRTREEIGHLLRAYCEENQVSFGVVVFEIIVDDVLRYCREHES